MQTILKDLLKYTHGLGEVEAFKIITEKDGVSRMKATSKGMEIIIDAKINQTIPEFVREEAEKANSVGFLNLDVLQGYLKATCFNDEEGVTITPVKRQDGVIIDLVLTSSVGHRFTYRTLDPVATKARIRTFSSVVQETAPTFQFTPTDSFFKDFQGIASVLGKFTSKFSFKNDNGVLKIEIGGEDNSASIPVTTCSPELQLAGYNFPIKQVQGILRQAPSLENVTISIDDERGQLEIEVVTDIAVYSFVLNSD